MNQTRNRSLCVFADGQPIAAGHRLRLRGCMEADLSPSIFSMTIFLPDAGLADYLKGCHHVSVEGEDHDLLASGEIFDVLETTEEGEAILIVLFSPDWSFLNSTVSVSFPSGTSVKEMASGILSSCSVPTSLVSFPDSTLSFPRGCTFHGRTLDALRGLANDMNARFFLCPSGVCFVSKEVYTPVLQIPSGDLLDSPELESDRVRLKTKVKGYPVGTVATWAPGESGVIFSQTFDADTGSGAWYSMLEIQTEAKP